MQEINILNLIKTVGSALMPCCKDPACAEQESWWLVEKATNKRRAELLAKRELIITTTEQELLTTWINQRVRENKPLAYILGSVPFCDLDILVKPPILIPRPETEEWVEWLINLLQKCKITSFTALDLCCGSGCIGLALAKKFPQAKVVGIDINPEAIKLCVENKNHNKIQNIEFIESDLFENLPPNFKCNLIVSNPPYLAEEEFVGLDAEVKKWEDHAALVAKDRGMSFYHRILKEAPKRITLINGPANALLTSPDRTSVPQVVMEIGPTQDQIENILPSYKLKKFSICKDMQGKNRWIGCWI